MLKIAVAICISSMVLFAGGWQFKKISSEQILGEGEYAPKNITSKSDFKSYGLSGKNKPNGMLDRLRISVPKKAKSLQKSFYNEELETIIADREKKGWFIMSRTPLSSKNNHFAIDFIDFKGEQGWATELSYMYKNKNVEIADIHKRGKTIYFNTPCRSINDKGCGAIYAYVVMEEMPEEYKWISKENLSNDIFLVKKDYIISGYGGEGKDNFLYLIDIKSGKVMDKFKLESPHHYLEFKDNKLHVITYKKHYIFDVERKGSRVN